MTEEDHLTQNGETMAKPKMAVVREVMLYFWATKAGRTYVGTHEPEIRDGDLRGSMEAGSVDSLCDDGLGIFGVQNLKPLEVVKLVLRPTSARKYTFRTTVTRTPTKVFKLEREVPEPTTEAEADAEDDFE
jgi:hypothetical protein